MKSKNSNLMVFSILIVIFLISFSTLFVINKWYLSENDLLHTKLYNEKIEEGGKKIFVIGNSHIGILDSNYIEKIIKEENLQFEIHKIAMTATRPTFWLPSLDRMISLEPDYVFFGLDMIELSPEKNLVRNWGEPVEIKKQSFLPEIQIPIQKSMQSHKEVTKTSYYFKNPKLTTLKLIDSLFIQEKEEEQPVRIITLKTHEELQTLSKRFNIKYQLDSENNLQLYALEEFVKKFSENNIEVVIFVTPRPQEWLDLNSEENTQQFFEILEGLSKKYNMKYYSLKEKYAKQNVWMDQDHVITGEPRQIYSEDVAKIIIKRLNS